jgi:hypothetical protein
MPLYQAARRQAQVLYRRFGPVCYLQSISLLLILASKLLGAQPRVLRRLRGKRSYYPMKWGPSFPRGQKTLRRNPSFRAPQNETNPNKPRRPERSRGTLPLRMPTMYQSVPGKRRKAPRTGTARSGQHAYQTPALSMVYAHRISVRRTPSLAVAP